MALVYLDDEESGLIKYRAYAYKEGDDRFFQNEAEIDEYIAALPKVDLNQFLDEGGERGQ